MPAFRVVNRKYPNKDMDTYSEKYEDKKIFSLEGNQRNSFWKM